MHATIERAKKQTSIYSPDQWDTIFQMARRYNPYIVVPMRFDSFYDLKAYSKANYKNFKTDTEGCRVNWLKVKVLRVCKESAAQIFVKYDFKDEEFKSVNVGISTRGRPKQMNELHNKYNTKLPISVAKKKDLIDLCKSYTIPEQHWNFYTNLSTDKKVKDRLTSPDVLEDEIDTDSD